LKYNLKNQRKMYSSNQYKIHHRKINNVQRLPYSTKKLKAASYEIQTISCFSLFENQVSIWQPLTKSLW
jgi:hypothetical protein